MRIIDITGAAGAGKDAIIEKLASRLEKEYPGKIAYARYFTTRRQLRPGETADQYFISEAQYDERCRDGTVKFGGANAGYRVGYDPREFEKADVVIINMDSENARKVRSYVEASGGKMLTIYLYAPRQQRIERIRRRDGWLIYEPAEFKVDNDITPADPNEHSDFDVTVENADGDFEKTLQEISRRVREFINEP